MVKDSRKNNAAELKKVLNGEDKSTIPSCSGVGARSDAVVILDARRRNVKPAKSETSAIKRAPWPRPNDLGEQIGKELRELYDDMLSQPVPDRFVELLNELEKGSISPVAKARTPGGG
jgi:hypothetical protein